ncbi:uncharacterized protein DUF4166 [Diaminobutyricimonas aerilata]|uniref:Uncharacterized protein DUF4166 n=1 Tax=Diaminobutyricimonas aerilata TaxID=1162967 RepID=A0A2M9CMJ7_9MICO|nr:DUF4166 domain-containing protein [Diaminobutyricimonas aerilata]PJJ73126.1 uncharacterized protein DUF4166 [Diaminobutyricimonas aerilata]
MSIFRRALGADFDRLHPMLQRRFGVSLDAGYACVGRGTMSSIRRGPWWTVPFLQVGRLRNILIPDVGSSVPFTIENYPYRDPFGRETVTFVREYRVRERPSRFDATMVYSDRSRRVIDYLGTHQHLAVDLDLTVEPDGSLLLRSEAQRFYEGPLVGFRFPMLFSGRAELRERFDDATGLFHIHLEVRNSVFGFLFGYEGSFACEFPPAVDAPEHLKPRRHERRE